jgi:putative NADPH-quinone reductase
MKTLIIIANPSKKSFSHAMADAYSKKCEIFEILDLYDFNQSYFKYESMDELHK